MAELNLNAKLTELGLALPPAPEPVAAYLPWRVDGSGQIVVSGQLPMKDGELLATGPLPDTSLEQAQQAARQCVLNGLAIIDKALDGDWSRFSHMVRIGVFVCSDPLFTEQHKVANGASELLAQVLGDQGRHARAAVGVIALPLGATVELELTAAVTGA